VEADEKERGGGGAGRAREGGDIEAREEILREEAGVEAEIGIEGR
jgi:hypothetical protein